MDTLVLHRVHTHSYIDEPGITTCHVRTFVPWLGYIGAMRVWIEDRDGNRYERQFRGIDRGTELVRI